MGIAIARALVERILAEARASPDREICGVLFGDETAIKNAVAAANVAEDAARSFEIDPAALFAAMRGERAGGPRLIGYYHSHPSGACEPSTRDAADAEPGRLWLIVAGDGAGLWRSGAEGFTRVKMVLA